MYSRTCKENYEKVNLFNRRAYQIKTVLGVNLLKTIFISRANEMIDRYFTPLEITYFRELQATTGTIISGSTALQFFDRTDYANSDLDLYVEHSSARPIATWLQNIGYIFTPQEDSEFQTLEMGLDKKTDDNTEEMPTLFDQLSPKGYFDAIAVLDFKKENHPPIQVITSKGPPLELVLDFHSSELYYKVPLYDCSINS